MAVIEKRVGKDGEVNYRVKVRIKGYRSLSSTFGRLTDAKQWAQQQEADIRRGLKFDDHLAQKKTLNDAVEEYLVHPHKMKPRQLKQRKRMLEWWQERLGSNFLSDITVAKLDALKRELMQKRKRDKGEWAKIAPATIHSYLIALSAVLNHARKELHWIHANPMEQVKKPTIKNARTRFLTDDERKSLLKVCREKGRHPMLYPLVLSAITTGMRQGELLNLRWKDVHFEKGVIQVQDSKNGDKRSVPFAGITASVLHDMSKVRRLDTDLVFARKDGLAPIELKKQWAAAFEQAKLTDFRFHDLRHTAASNLLSSGATLGELSAILGHRSLQMVKRYAHLADNQATVVVKRMMQRVFGS